MALASFANNKSFMREEGCSTLSECCQELDSLFCRFSERMECTSLILAHIYQKVTHTSKKPSNWVRDVLGRCSNSDEDQISPVVSFIKETNTNQRLEGQGIQGFGSMVHNFNLEESEKNQSPTRSHQDLDLVLNYLKMIRNGSKPLNQGLSQLIMDFSRQIKGEKQGRSSSANRNTHCSCKKQLQMAIKQLKQFYNILSKEDKNLQQFRARLREVQQLMKTQPEQKITTSPLNQDKHQLTVGVVKSLSNGLDEIAEDSQDFYSYQINPADIDHINRSFQSAECRNIFADKSINMGNYRELEQLAKQYQEQKYMLANEILRNRQEVERLEQQVEHQEKRIKFEKERKDNNTAGIIQTIKFLQVKMAEMNGEITMLKNTCEKMAIDRKFWIERAEEEKELRLTALSEYERQLAEAHQKYKQKMMYLRQESKQLLEKQSSLLNQLSNLRAQVSYEKGEVEEFRQMYEKVVKELQEKNELIHQLETKQNTSICSSERFHSEVELKIGDMKINNEEYPSGKDIRIDIHELQKREAGLKRTISQRKKQLRTLQCLLQSKMNEMRISSLSVNSNDSHSQLLEKEAEIYDLRAEMERNKQEKKKLKDFQEVWTEIIKAKEARNKLITSAVDQIDKNNQKQKELPQDGTQNPVYMSLMKIYEEQLRKQDPEQAY